MASFDAVSEVLRVLRLEGRAIQDCAARLAGESQKKAIQKAIDLLQGALVQGGKIVVTGVGKSGKVAQKIAATLSSTGSLAIFLHPTEGLHGDLGVVSGKDAVLALSYTGNTEELVKLLPSLKALQVSVIGIGGNPASQLASQCDAWIDAAVEQEACPHNLAPTSSTTLALALGDALALALMQLRGFDSQAFAQNHPGGSLGRRLHLRVSDVMHTGDSVPYASPDSPVEEIVVLLTQKNLGGVLITEGPARKLLGIVVEGDIRRALKHREKFFSLRASDVMTCQPAVVMPQMMAKAALELMENRPGQISVLPVVDGEGNCQGLLRLHDIVRAF